MSADGLEQTLRQLPRLGKLVKDRGYRQVWRFEHGGRAFYLKFYLKKGGRDRFRRLFRGSPAVAEFLRLQRLQTAKIPSPRAVAVLTGFRLEDRIGDAVILEAIEPAVPLDEYFNDYERRGEPVPDRLKIAEQIREIVHLLLKNKLGHEDLHLGNFLLKEGKVYLLDGYAVRMSSLTLRQLLYLGHSVSRYATRTDLRRGWDDLGPGGPMPRRNKISGLFARDFIRGRIMRENRYFGRIGHDDWSGFYFKYDKFPRRWSAASALHISPEDWQRELPRLLELLAKDELKVLKRSRSGDVLAGEITVGGTLLPVILKRPRRRYWYRYINEIGRGSRARRAWVKAWRVILRNWPTAWPLMYVEKFRVGYVTDSLIVFERVPGPLLARVELDAMTPTARDMLFRRTGRLLRKIDQEGMAHFDAKASNWIVRPDEKFGPSPVMIDIDGIRQRRWTALGIQRLLKSMRDNKQYSIADSLSLCQGYAPTVMPRVETAEEAEAVERVQVNARVGNAESDTHLESD